MTKSVYKLKPILSDPRFGGFVFADSAKSLTGGELAGDDFRIEASSLDWVPRRLEEIWIPQKVTGPVRQFNDYPCIELRIPAFSKRAAVALDNLLRPNGELLPLETSVGIYYAYNLTTKSDALNAHASTVVPLPGANGVALDIKRYSFREESLSYLSIFRLREHPQTLYVTDTFRNRVEDAGLNGFDFIKVWPLSEGTDWQSEQRKARRKSKDAVQLNGESVILRFRLQSNNANPDEQRKFDSYVEQLYGFLGSDFSIEAPYRGMVEVVELVEGEGRIFLSCPHAKELMAYLQDWLDSSDWPGEFDVVVRTGNIFDHKAKERRVKVK